ncbi:MAG: SDR family oxidoreductase [Schwartzia succinivorans]|jgi:NAD(P)-dependent dehydrogenase (short-subunit alcohol dehydrogenase family)|uniref:SDR family NAD(P)-dependent oxidoreductase n=1 Tax=Schwartzia succinivorans TaxID=55507 RepID=UPI0023547679|nr:SDR family oxidoreductase [Schwartzia succinivorans]MBE6097704.1 SDR family oxidoreductase [Schwartzia succinivorans]
MPDISFNFANRRFIVTGATSGMGRQVAIELAEAGAIVLAMGRREDCLQELKKAFPDNIIPASLDIRDDGKFEEYIREFVQKYGKLNGVVHAAGIIESTPLRTYDEEKAKEIMDISFWRGIRLVQLTNKAKYAEHGCSSILFSSVAAHIGEKGLFAYSASKAALQVAVRTLAKEIYKNSKRINTISPGWVKTEMTQKELETTAVNPEIFNRHLLGLGESQYVSGMILFLLSDRAKWITGQDFVIDGGYLLGGYN